jgi:hypothetical protein
VFSEFAFAVNGVTPVAPFVQCVAVSATADATGAWNRYAFSISSTQQEFPDQKLFLDNPKLAIWPDGYYLSFNEFDLDTTPATFVGGGALALERSKMLTGAPAQARFFDLQSVHPGIGGLVPATLDTANPPPVGAPELYLQSSQADTENATARLRVMKFKVDWSTPEGATFTHLDEHVVDAFNSTFYCGPSTTPDGPPTPDCILQPSVAAPTLDPVATVVQDDPNTTPASPVHPQLMYHVDYLRDGPTGPEHLVATQTVNAGGNQAGVRWYELTNATPSAAENTWSVDHQGTYVGSPADSESRFMSSGGLDKDGGLAIAYSVSSLNTPPSLRYTGGLPGDLAGNPSIAETPLANGVASSTTGQWGGYSSLSLDPLDLCTFWFTGEYEGMTTWQTRISEFSLPACVPQSPTRPWLTADPTWPASTIVREGVAMTGTAATFNGATAPVTYQWQRCDRYGFSCVKITDEPSNLPSLTFGVNDAAGDRTVRLQTTATNSTGESIAVSTATPVVQSLPPAPRPLTAPPVISGTPEDGQTLVTTNGTWDSSSPVTFTYKWRRCIAPAPCVNIAGATQSSYTLTTADVTTSVDVVVSATNTGGGYDANAVATGPVATAPVTGGTPPPVPPVTTGGTPPAVPPATTGSTPPPVPPVTTGGTPPAVLPPTSTPIPAGLNGTPKAGPDKKNPTAHPLASKGTRGHTAKLRLRIYDDRGVAKAVATVKRNGKVVGTAKTGLGPVAYGSSYFVGWHVAAKAPKGRYTFCVVATDRAGNHSPSSCARLVLK